MGSKILAVLGFGAAVDAQHGGLRGAVDVGVEHAHVGAFGGQRQRQIDGGGGLADTALAGGHGDDVLDAGDEFHALLYAVGHDFPGDIGCRAFHAGDGLDLVLDHGLDLAGDHPGRVGQHHIQSDLAAVHLDVLGRLGGDEVLLGVGVDEFFECGLHLLFGNRHG
jgi:hypothetical protein